MGERGPVLYQRLAAEIPAFPVEQEIIDGGTNGLTCPTTIPCEVLREATALRDGFDLRVAIKKEASCSSFAHAATSRSVIAFRVGRSQPSVL